MVLDGPPPGRPLQHTQPAKPADNTISCNIRMTLDDAKSCDEIIRPLRLVLIDAVGADPCRPKCRRTPAAGRATQRGPKKHPRWPSASWRLRMLRPPGDRRHAIVSEPPRWSKQDVKQGEAWTWIRLWIPPPRLSRWWAPLRDVTSTPVQAAVVRDMIFCVTRARPICHGLRSRACGTPRRTIAASV